jgi:hypothetical protein
MNSGSRLFAVGELSNAVLTASPMEAGRGVVREVACKIEPFGRDCAEVCSSGRTKRSWKG